MKSALIDTIKVVDEDGKVLSLREIGKKYGISPYVVKNRYYRGDTVDRLKLKEGDYREKSRLLGKFTRTPIAHVKKSSNYYKYSDRPRVAKPLSEFMYELGWR